MLNVALVDDQTLVRSGIRGLLDLTGDIRVTIEADSAPAALAALASAAPPDVLLLDIRMAGMSGIDLLEQLNLRGKAPPTILLTTFDDDLALLSGMRLGARGFLLKDITLAQLATAIRAVASGKTAFLPAISDRLVKALGQQETSFDSAVPPERLTPREVEILRLMVAGLNNREIAAGLNTSEGTVKNQVSSILAKLGVRDRIRAVLRGLELGVV